MKRRLIVYFSLIGIFNAMAVAQTTTAQTLNVNVAVGQTVQALNQTYSCLFTTKLTGDLTSSASSVQVATTQGNATTSVTISVTGVNPGSATYVVTATPPCGFSTITLNVTVTGSGGTGSPPPPVSSANTLSAPVVAEPVSAATGELFGHDETADLSLGGPMGLEFRRYYASWLASNKVSSALGTNWMHSFDVSLAVSGAKATVTLFRGKTVTFSQSGNTWNLSSNERRPYQLAAVAAGGYQFLDPGSNRIYGFGSTGAIASIQDRNGNAITITQGANGPTLVSDGLGRTLTFTYTGTNLTKVQDQSGRSVTFQYTNGALSAFTDANGNPASYAYTSSGGVNGLMTVETRPAGNKPFTQTFDSTGRVSTQSDSLSNTMTLAYAAGNGGATLTETGGVSLTLANDSNLNLTATSDPTGGASKYAYDSNNRPTATTDRLGNQSKATWDTASGLPASYTDELGNTTSFTYATSALGAFTFYDLKSSTFADGTAISLTRDSKGNVTSVTDQAGNIWQSTYTANGWLATTTNPSGGVYTFAYNGDGTRASVQTPSSDTTKFAYDGVSRPNLVTNPDSTTKGFQYDAVSNVLKTTDERNNSVSASFDANNNIKTTADALAATANFAFDTDDRLATSTDPLGKAITAAYDTQSRLKSLTNAAGNSAVWTYDNLNRVTAIVDASGNGFTYGLDGENRPTSITDALSRAVNYTRDAHGNVTTVATPKKETFSNSYDALNRLVSTTDPLGRTTQFTRDPRGIPTAAVLPGGVGASFGLNALGLTTSVTDPVGNVWNRVFDNMGRLTSSIDPLNRKTSFTYDSRQRISSATLPPGTAQYSWDAASNLTSLNYSDGTSLSYTWDADNRLTGASGLSLSYDSDGRITASNGLQIARDPAGRIASVTYATGKTVNYTYNNRGFISQVADWVGGNTTFTYDAAGQLTTMAFANGVSQAYTWDADGRLLTLAVSKGGTTLSSITLTRDTLGRIASAARTGANIPAEAKGVLQLAYDGAAQTLGNSFDGLGRVSQDSHRAYVWDLASRLTSYSGSDGSASFTYDAMGQRLSRTSGGATQNYVWNYAFPLPALSTVQAGGADQTYYIWLPGGALLNSISAVDGSRRFYHFDESGSTVLLTDSTGTVTDTYAVSIYGDTVTQTGSTSNPFTWQGRSGVMCEGSTSMYYMRARYYDSGPARFLSRDPLSSKDPRDINPYQFVHANPVGHADPTGMGSEVYELDRGWGFLMLAQQTRADLDAKEYKEWLTWNPPVYEKPVIPVESVRGDLNPVHMALWDEPTYRPAVPEPTAAPSTALPAAQVTTTISTTKSPVTTLPLISAISAVGDVVPNPQPPAPKPQTGADTPDVTGDLMRAFELMSGEFYQILVGFPPPPGPTYEQLLQEARQRRSVTAASMEDTITEAATINQQPPQPNVDPRDVM